MTPVHTAVVVFLPHHALEKVMQQTVETLPPWSTRLRRDTKERTRCKHDSIMCKCPPVRLKFSWLSRSTPGTVDSHPGCSISSRCAPHKSTAVRSASTCIRRMPERVEKRNNGC